MLNELMYYGTKYRGREGVCHESVEKIYQDRYAMSIGVSWDEVSR